MSEVISALPERGAVAEAVPGDDCGLSFDELMQELGNDRRSTATITLPILEAMLSRDLDEARRRHVETMVEKIRK